MELKSLSLGGQETKVLSSNRTFMELKSYMQAKAQVTANLF